MYTRTNDREISTIGRKNLRGTNMNLTMRDSRAPKTKRGVQNPLGAGWMRGSLPGAPVLALVLALTIGALQLPSADQAGLQKIYVGNSLGNDITVIDLKTMKVTGGIVVGDHPHGVTAQPDGRRLFATVESDHTLRIIDTSTDKITG